MESIDVMRERISISFRLYVLKGFNFPVTARKIIKKM